MYYLNTRFLFLPPLKCMVIMELSSKILSVLSVIKQENEEVAYGEVQSLVKELS